MHSAQPQCTGTVDSDLDDKYMGYGMYCETICM